MRCFFALITFTLGITTACHRPNIDVAGGELASVIIFQNQSLDEAAVYAVEGTGAPLRIATVAAGQTDTLNVPPSMLSTGQSVSILARPLARNIAVRTGPLAIVPGDWLLVRLPLDERTLVVLPGKP